MTPHAKDVLEGFEAVDWSLQQLGWVPTSPWWHDEIRRFYASGAVQFVPRVGRRGGKSSTLCRLAVAEALYGHHRIPHGDVGTVAFIAQNKPEAAKRLRTIKDILRALSIEFAPTANGVELVGRPIAFEVYAATVQGVSGFTSIFVVCDEVSKWKDVEHGVNPASLVLESVRPTMGTQPEARIVLSSSPMGRFDAHYDAFEQGDNDFQRVAYAPTWLANPTLSEERTRKLEPDPAAWRREWLAVPSDTVAEGILTLDELLRATRAGDLSLPWQVGHEYVAAMDPATRGNAWTLAVVTSRHCPSLTSDGKPFLRLKKSVVYNREWRGSTLRPLSPKSVLHEISGILQSYSADTLWTDQGAGPDALRDLAAGFGVNLISEPTTVASKRDMFKNLAVMVRTDQAELPDDPVLRQDLLQVRRHFTRGGEHVLLEETTDGRHSDYAPAVALALSRFVRDPDLTAASDPRAVEAAEKRARHDYYRQEQERPFWLPRQSNRGWWR